MCKILLSCKRADQNFLASYKNFCLWQKWFCPGQRIIKVFIPRDFFGLPGYAVIGSENAINKRLLFLGGDHHHKLSTQFKNLFFFNLFPFNIISPCDFTHLVKFFKNEIPQLFLRKSKHTEKNFLSMLTKYFTIQAVFKNGRHLWIRII